jgi:hypothetical protein
MTALLTPPASLPTEVLAEMRAWIGDCVWSDLDQDDIAELTDRQIINGVRRHYSGGVHQFIADFYAYGPEEYYAS